MSTRTTHRALRISTRVTLRTAVASYVTLTLIPWATDYATTGARTPRTGLLLAALPVALLFGALAGYATAPLTQAQPHASGPGTTEPAGATARGAMGVASPVTGGATLCAPTRAGPDPARPTPASSPPDQPARQLHLITSTAQPPRPTSHHDPDVAAGT